MDKLPLDKCLGSCDGRVPDRCLTDIPLRMFQYLQLRRLVIDKGFVPQLALSNYMVDAYLVVAASVLASSTVIRSLFGAGFPVSRAFALYERVTDAVSPFSACSFLAIRCIQH